MEYPAKILLFGEYGIILNSMALAIPFPQFSGRFRFSDTSHELSPVEDESNIALNKFLLFLKSNADNFRYIYLMRFESEINHGLYFDSSIPFGSGLGSSGALVAALYARYSTQLHYNPDYRITKANLAQLESFFHGTSSGIDPLISLLKKPILIGRHTSKITPIDLSQFINTYTIFLINTHSKGNTGGLVNYFMEQYRIPDFKKLIDNQYIPVINQTITAVAEANMGSFNQLVSKYSEFQLTYFGQMISPEMKTHFEHGIKSGDFYLKLCGSGGGGYILGYTRDRLKAESYFNLNHLDWTIV